MWILIQDLGSTFLAYGRHLWHVDPNDPTFRSRTRNIFQDADVRINVRGRRSMRVVFFFFMDHILIIIIIWRPDAKFSDPRPWIKAGSNLDQRGSK